MQFAVNCSNKTRDRMFYLLLLMIGVVVSTPLLGKSVWLVLPLLFSIPYLFKVSAKPNHLSQSVLLYIILAIGYRIIGLSDAGAGDYMKHLFFFVPIFLMFFLSKRRTSLCEKKYWWLIHGVMIANIAINIYLCIKYPSINLRNVREMFDENFLEGLNVGGSKFYNFAFFYYSVCFFVFLNTKKKIPKIAMLAGSLITGLYICLFCFKASVILFTVIITILLYSAKKIKSKVLFVILCLFISFYSVIIINANENEMINNIVRLSPDQRVSQRFVALIDANSIEANDESLNERTRLMFVSLETWLDNPLNFVFGIGDHRSQFNAAETGIGQHSDFLDSLARYGLIGFLLLFSIFRFSFKYIMSFFDKDMSLQLECLFIVVIVFSFTKAIFIPSIGYVLFILLPLSSRFVNSEIIQHAQ